VEAGLEAAKANDRTTVLVIDTDPLIATEAGGHWWDVAVPEVSSRAEVNAARADYERAIQQQRID
jgi:3D-(3,5/4)-trihydroxycyclohexane-1,2-dione acylhydrolase (decyclizing)